MEENIDLLDDILIQERSINLQTLSDVITLAVEIAREGREGRRIGTLFVISDEETVLPSSKPLILDPLWYHPGDEKHIKNPNMRETIKELAQLDGAFVVADDGTVLSAWRYINASAAGISLPPGSAADTWLPLRSVKAQTVLLSLFLKVLWCESSIMEN
jgi:diadenylate cyclase